jgi:putative transposase
MVYRLPDRILETSSQSLLKDQDAPSSVRHSAIETDYFGSCSPRRGAGGAIVFNQRHLRRTLARYLFYYHGSRTHLSLAKDAPTSRRVQAVTDGDVMAFPEVGGLHHRYERRAA